MKKYIKNFRQNQYVGYDNPRYEYQLNRTKEERDMEYELRDYMIKESDERMVLSQNEHDCKSRVDRDIQTTVCNLLSYWGLQSKWSLSKQEIMANVIARYDAMDKQLYRPNPSKKKKQLKAKWLAVFEKIRKQRSREAHENFLAWY